MILNCETAVTVVLPSDPQVLLRNDVELHSEPRLVVQEQEELRYASENGTGGSIAQALRSRRTLFDPLR